MGQITISSQNKSISLESSHLTEDLLTLLVDHDIEIPHACGGHGSCATCVIKVQEGEECLSPLTQEEKGLLGNVYHLTKERLACQACYQKEGDITLKI